MAGEYAQILTPMAFFQFITSPISQVAIISGKQRIDLLWQIVLFILLCAAFAVSGYFKSLQVALILFSVVYSLMYVAAGLINYKISFGGENERIYKKAIASEADR